MTNLLSKQPVGIDSRWSSTLQRHRLLRQALPWMLALLAELLRGCKSVTYVCDKRFLIILMFCDYAVKACCYERGFNFYEDGQNYGMVSLLAKAGSTLLGKSEFDALLAVFQRAVKEKTSGALDALVVAARKTEWQKLPEVIGPLAKYAAPECLEAIATEGDHRCGAGRCGGDLQPALLHPPPR